MLRSCTYGKHAASVGLKKIACLTLDSFSKSLHAILESFFKFFLMINILKRNIDASHPAPHGLSNATTFANMPGAEPELHGFARMVGNGVGIPGVQQGWVMDDTCMRYQINILFVPIAISNQGWGNG